jgi:hypothetical protein
MIGRMMRLDLIVQAAAALKNPAGGEWNEIIATL